MTATHRSDEAVEALTAALDAGQMSGMSNSELAAAAVAIVAQVLDSGCPAAKEVADAWRVLGGEDMAWAPEVSFGPARRRLRVVQPHERRTLADALRHVETGAAAVHAAMQSAYAELDELRRER